MKIYKIKTMSGTEIPLKEEELEGVLRASQGKGLIMTSYGVVNGASIDSITLHRELMKEIQNYGTENAEQEILGNSPFAKALMGKNEMKMLKE